MPDIWAILKLRAPLFQAFSTVPHADTQLLNFFFFSYRCFFFTTRGYFTVQTMRCITREPIAKQEQYDSISDASAIHNVHPILNGLWELLPASSHTFNDYYLSYFTKIWPTFGPQPHWFWTAFVDSSFFPRIQRLRRLAWIFLGRFAFPTRIRGPKNFWHFRGIRVFGWSTNF